MTVGELRKALEGVDDDMTVFIADLYGHNFCTPASAEVIRQEFPPSNAPGTGDYGPLDDLR